MKPSFSRKQKTTSVFGEYDGTKECRICWLDEECESTATIVDNIKMVKLRGISECLHHFTKINVLEQKIRQWKDETLFLVANISSAEAFLRLHELAQVHCIYMYDWKQSMPCEIPFKTFAKVTKRYQLILIIRITNGCFHDKIQCLLQ
jgi:hypothetical protein